MTFPGHAGLQLLHVCPFYEPAWGYGGMARATTQQCEALARRGHDVTVITSLLDPSHPARERRGGVDVHRLDGPGALRGRLVPGARGAGALVASLAEGAQLAHLHGTRSVLVLAAASGLRRTGKSWVTQPHGTWPHHGRHRLAKAVVDRLGGRRVVGEAAAVIAVSRAEAAELPAPARVIPNGVCQPASGQGPQRAGRLLFVGSDHPQKRVGMLGDLLRALPRAHLALAGRFGERFLEALRRLGPRVEVLGVLDPAALAGEYRAASLVVHPAVGEAFGLVPFEAALAGTPAVVAGGHGCGEWFGAAGGCVVPPDDPGELTRAVAARLAHPEIGLAEAGRVADFARRELTWERNAEQLEQLYRELLGGMWVRP